MKQTCFMAICCALIFVGCKDVEHPLIWRSDVAPIVKRIPVLSSCTNMLWHGEVITKNTFMSTPGPSAYRVCCFIPCASTIIPSLQNTTPSADEILDEDTFYDAEKAVLNSRYGIVLGEEKAILNEVLNRELLHSPYWGYAIFFKQRDVLCIIFFGE